MKTWFELTLSSIFLLLYISIYLQNFIKTCNGNCNFVWSSYPQWCVSKLTERKNERERENRERDGENDSEDWNVIERN